MRDNVAADEYVRNSRERVLQVIKSSEDPYTRACAWALLDRYTPNEDIDQLHDELDELGRR